MNRVKKTISFVLDIASERLNEISLEDIEIEQDSQDQIYHALIDMILKEEPDGILTDSGINPKGIPCTGFWVEGTQELILFAWCLHKHKTIVIPAEEWFLREDITVH